MFVCPACQNQRVLAVAARSGQESGHGTHVPPASLPGPADGQRPRRPSRRSHRRGRCSHQMVDTAEPGCAQPLTSIIRMRSRYCYWWMGFCPLRLVADLWIASPEFSEVSCGPAAHKRNPRVGVPWPDAVKSPESVRELGEQRFPVATEPVSEPNCRASPPNSRKFNRGARIRTGDLLLPKQARYRTAPRPVHLPPLVLRHPNACGSGGVRSRANREEPAPNPADNGGFNQPTLG